MDKYAQKDKKNMCNNCKETNQPENPTAINADVELKEGASDFRMFRNNVKEAILSLEEYCRFTKGKRLYYLYLRLSKV